MTTPRSTTHQRGITDRAGRTLSKRTRAALVTAALAISLASLGLGAGPAVAASHQAASTAQVLKLVAQAPKIKSVPSNLTPSPSQAENDVIYLQGCQPDYGQVTVGRCIFGDTAAKQTIALLGDSHAGMWFPAINTIAKRNHLRLVLFEKSGCPSPDTSFWNNTNNAPYPQCDQWHTYVINRIKKLDPKVLIVTSADFQAIDGSDKPMSDATWTTALTKTLTLAASPNTKEVVLGDIPYLSQVDADCITAHESDVPACATPASQAVVANAQADNQLAAQNAHALYINVVPWLCTSTCSPIIGNMLVYENRYHITETYALYLSGALQSALQPVLAP